MSTKYFDIVVAKEFETEKSGITERKTVWNKVGRAWATQKPGSYNFELFLMPGIRYLINLREKNEEKEEKSRCQTLTTRFHFNKS